jgi:GNAT superfamily N-acetyltransferase
VKEINFEIRPATLDDVEDIADAHLDSIRTIGSHYYSPEILNDWSAQINGDLYIDAMNQGEVFFIAVSKGEMLGFSSHRVDDGEHGVSVYVRGSSARRGLGSALLRMAEDAAITRGAKSIQIASSLAAVAFYAANGFEEISRGEHQLASGKFMPCVFMQKRFTTESRRTRKS